MQINCPRTECHLSLLSGLKQRRIVRKGFYYRKSDSRRIRRYICKNCQTQFSSASQSPKRYQKVRRITHPLKGLLVSGVSQRRAARLLGVNPKTVARRFRFLAHEARLEQAHYLKKFEETPLASIQFDDLETSEHSKCKPLSVALAIEPMTRKILGFQVSQMPAKGHLVKKAIRKYGYRRDERGKGWSALLGDLKKVVSPEVIIRSDENPHYPHFFKKYFPFSTHESLLGGRGALGGQGELKKKRFDPLFALNHSCAMLRANLNRLFRKTWCTTKTRQGLIDHLSIYMNYHNQILTPPYPFLGGS